MRNIENREFNTALQSLSVVAIIFRRSVRILIVYRFDTLHVQKFVCAMVLNSLRKLEQEIQEIQNIDGRLIPDKMARINEIS